MIKRISPGGQPVRLNVWAQAVQQLHALETLMVKLGDVHWKPGRGEVSWAFLSGVFQDNWVYEEIGYPATMEILLKKYRSATNHPFNLVEVAQHLRRMAQTCKNRIAILQNAPGPEAHTKALISATWSEIRINETILLLQ